MSKYDELFERLRKERENFKRSDLYKKSQCVPSFHRRGAHVHQKPPKMRYKLDELVVYEGEVFRVKYAYRLRENVHEWIYCIESTDTIPLDLISAAIFPAPEGLERIVYEPFRSSMDATSHFFKLPNFGSSAVCLTNNDMINKTKPYVKKE